MYKKVLHALLLGPWRGRCCTHELASVTPTKQQAWKLGGLKLELAELIAENGGQGQV
jgi:hypothetical protein